jgi:hypothetical protein
MMLGIFGILAPGHIPANMLASGTTGTIAVESEALMQDYKAGDMIGSSPKYLTIMQLLATPIGAAAVSWMYPLLRDTYGIVGEHAGLTSPISSLEEVGRFCRNPVEGCERSAARSDDGARHRLDSRRGLHRARDAQVQMGAFADSRRHRHARAGRGDHRDVSGRCGGSDMAEGRSAIE